MAEPLTPPGLSEPQGLPPSCQLMFQLHGTPSNPKTCQAHFRLRTFARTICSSTWNFLFQISSRLAPPSLSDLCPHVTSLERILVHPVKAASPLVPPSQITPSLQHQEPWPPCRLLSTQPGTVSMEVSGRPSGLRCAFAVFYRAGAGKPASGKHRSTYWPARDEGAPPSTS